ncbi:FAD binding domain-containing protein [Diaporthe helianthi]|uniref:FAD binding domain-containing protein n=1 Tax=Diaporthe helianthi TaxID=158607 RepID=A0A2P5I8C5_DIAHE|nr:FAD binding domain-containing protein [Diaporthe helianthi]
MKWCSLITAFLGLAATAQAATAWQQRNQTFAVVDAPLGLFSNFADKASAKASLEATLNLSKISRPGDFRYGQTIARTWSQQRKIWPEWILYPEDTIDVSIILQFYSAAHTFWGDDGFAIMGGGHADFGGAQSPSIIIDLFRHHCQGQLHQPSTSWPILKVGGGSEAGDVYSLLNGTGWAFLGPRDGPVGVGGFLLGGGIAFQTSRYRTSPTFGLPHL